MTAPLKDIDSEIEKALVKAFGLVRHPDKHIKLKGWWYETELYDADFEEVVGHHYHNAKEYLEEATQSIKHLVAREKIKELELLIDNLRENRRKTTHGLPRYMIRERIKELSSAVAEEQPNQPNRKEGK